MGTSEIRPSGAEGSSDANIADLEPLIDSIGSYHQNLSIHVLQKALITKFPAK